MSPDTGIHRRPPDGSMHVTGCDTSGSSSTHCGMMYGYRIPYRIRKLTMYQHIINRESTLLDIQCGILYNPRIHPGGFYIGNRYAGSTQYRESPDPVVRR